MESILVTLGEIVVDAVIDIIDGDTDGVIVVVCVAVIIDDDESVRS